MADPRNETEQERNAGKIWTQSGTSPTLFNNDEVWVATIPTVYPIVFHDFDLNTNINELEFNFFDVPVGDVVGGIPAALWNAELGAGVLPSFEVLIGVNPLVGVQPFRMRKTYSAIEGANFGFRNAAFQITIPVGRANVVQTKNVSGFLGAGDYNVDAIFVERR